MRREGLLDLNEAVQHPGKKLVFKVETELGQEEDLDLVEPLRGELSAVSTGNLLLVKTTLRTRAVLECARCAAPVETDLEFTMEDEFDVEGVPSSFASDSYAEVVTDEPVPIFVQNALILDAYVRQGLLLNLPEQPLCSGGWDGVCQESVDTGHRGGEAVHPAFEGLSRLIDREAP